MYEQIIPWAGLALLLILCLPIPPVRRLVLALTTWSLRLALLALLGGGAYLWFRPADLPAVVLDTAANCPRLLTILPDPTTQTFGIALAAILVGPMVPILAALDACRLAARRRPDPDPARPAEAAAEVPPQAPAARAPLRRPVGRGAAAETIASAGARPR
jgi:hypothetical protein